MVVIGMISGTSVDAIDVAAARFEIDADVLTLERLGHAERAWPTELRARLLAVLPPAPVSLQEICALDVLVGEAFADAAGWAIGAFAPEAAVIASHGQTVFHWVEGGRARGTFQLGRAAVIAERTGIAVASDFRARDIAAGGQGAPLASTMDALWLGDDGVCRAALNLGGIANVTIVGASAGSVLAFDTGPANCLIDLEAQRLTGEGFDRDGTLARAGAVRADLLERLLAEPYYALPPPKSTGRELFDRAYVRRRLEGLPAVSGPDLIATLVELTARTVAEACLPYGVREVVVSGGGVRNPALMAALALALRPATLVSAEARGMPSDGKEAYLFALLGYLTWRGLAGSVPGATGATDARVLGSVTPGREGLRMAPAEGVVRRLVIAWTHWPSARRSRKARLGRG